MTMRLSPLPLVALLLAFGAPACSDPDGSPTDADASVSGDGGVRDAGQTDGSSPQGDGGGTLDTGPAGPRCGNGVQESGEACDGADLNGATCANQTASSPVGIVVCDACELDTSDCRAPTASDGDADMVSDDLDPEPANPRVCGDSDMDGCDDCSLRGRHSPANDGYDPNGDGDCELELDYDCMNGANAAVDPHRELACVTFAHINNDRAHFSEESGNAAPLVWNEDIWEVAVGHSRNMCNVGVFAHEIPNDYGPSQRAAAAGLGFSLAENISANLDPGAAQYGWMEEPTCRGHRGNNLHPAAFEAAVGYHICDRPTSQYQWGQHHHITTNFRRNNSPQSAYCQNAATSCEIPPNPPTTATCPAMLVSWGFCPASGPGSIEGWGCPND